MAEVHVDGDDLIVDIEGPDKLWALTSRMVIPLANIRGATADPEVVMAPGGVREPDTDVSGVLTSGIFRVDGERVFWDVHDPAAAVVIELADEHVTRLVIQVADPGTTVALIERAIRRR
jgi:hypothetical protein